MRRVLAWTLGVLAIVAIGAVVGIGWYYSGEILTVVEPGPPVYDTEVVGVDEETVSLQDTPAARQPGRWGLQFDGGYAQVGEVTDDGAGAVQRPLTLIEGTPEPGADADVDGYAYPEDPHAAGFDFPVQEVAVAAPLGDQPAWHVPGDARRWAIFVHGRAGGRHSCFRLLPLFTAAEFSSLCISYRNDPDGPADPQGLYRQGAAEWEDLEAAVVHAREQGAQSVVLVGYSMGGQITANFLRRSAHADLVDAVIWDAPLLDWGPAILAGAQERGVPEFLVPLGMRASELRAGVRYDELDQIDHADQFAVPILLIHGTADTTVPVSVSDRFAAARPDVVTYLRVEGAEHVTAWNVDPQRYEFAVTTFLDDHALLP